MQTYPPEKLNFWDRIFNRYKKIPIKEGDETWEKLNPIDYAKRLYNRDFVIYHVIDRLTGAYEIKKEYLN